MRFYEQESIRDQGSRDSCPYPYINGDYCGAGAGSERRGTYQSEDGETELKMTSRKGGESSGPPSGFQRGDTGI